MNRKYLIKTLGIVMGLTAFVSMLFGIFSVIGSNNDSIYVDFKTIKLVQREEIKEGAPIAIISTSMGEIRAVLYPEYAPNTVENFVRLANEGYYDNTYITSVIKNKYFMAGAPNSDGSGNEETDTGFASETSANLWPFKGAFISTTYNEISLDNKTVASGNRFIVCSSITIDDVTRESMLGPDGETLLADAFEQAGGIPAYSQKATVFAQTYEGFDVLDAIFSVQTSEDKPKEDIIIESIVISEYTAENAGESDNAQS